MGILAADDHRFYVWKFARLTSNRAGVVSPPGNGDLDIRFTNFLLYLSDRGISRTEKMSGLISSGIINYMKNKRAGNVKKEQTTASQR